MTDSKALEAVGHPLRLRILQHLSDDRTASVPELAEAAEAHENTVRAHVAVLERAGLIAGEPRPADGPGRPGLQYRLTAPGARLDQDFLGIAELLAAVVGRSGISRGELLAVGREWGRYLAGRPGRYDLRDHVPRILGGLGFEASVEADRVRLWGCPCPAVAADRPELICELTHGVLDGVLGTVGAGRHTGAGRHDPARRSCEIALVDGARSLEDGSSSTPGGTDGER